MAPIASLKKLRVLRFYTAPITDAGIAKIRGLSHLEDLQLGNSHGDAALQTIAGFVKLRTSISNTPELPMPVWST